MKLPFVNSVRVISLMILSTVLVLSSHAQSNIVFNGGFEDVDSGWTFFPGLEIYLNKGAAEGNIHVGVDDDLYQDLPTIAGRDYVLTFATSTGNRQVSVQWADATVTNLTNFAASGFLWKYFYAHVHADSNMTRLRFSGGLLDDVKVRWVQDPILIVAQPESRSAFEGATVSFSVTPDGVPPLRYQWFFNGAPIAGANSSSFTVIAARLTHAGQYSVMISNEWNSISSDVAQLQVMVPPTSPLIVSQPIGDLCPVGYTCSLGVFAVGEPVLQYQWMMDGNAISGATNSNLLFPAVQISDAGTYTVLVSNQHGSVLSLPATLAVSNSVGGSTVYLNNFTNNSPIYDVDGSTRLAGANFKAQVYAGATPNILRPVGPAVSFPSGFFAGYAFPQDIPREIPDVTSGQTAYIQVRAWEAAFGSSYEQARAFGGKFGFSGIYPTLNNQRVTTRSFNLRAGEPFFISGQLSVGEAQTNGTRQFILTGERAARYLIETRQPPNNWVPLLILTNTTGTATFTDANQVDTSIHFYRARLLD
jgi:hypothetical protein